MSKKELDQLFKNKLEDHTEPPSKEAWTKLQKGLKTKTSHNKGYYWKIAAAILVLMVFGGIIWWSFPAGQNSDNTANLSSKSTISSSNDSNSAKNTHDTLTKIDPEEKELADNKKSLEEVNKAVDKLQDSTSQNKQPVQNSQIKAIKKSNIGKQNVAVIDQPKKSQEEYDTDATKKEMPASTDQMKKDEAIAQNNIPKANKTLTFNIDEFESAKIVRSSDLPDTVSSGEEKQNKKGLKKLWAMVKSVNELDGIGQLREAKNELLAISDSPAEKK